MVASITAMAVWVVLEQWVIPPKPVDLTPFEREMEQWIAAKAAEAARDTMVPEPFAFDPNTIDRSGWIALGFTERQVDGIERYMAKGGRFRTKRDVSRLYSLRPGQYERLEPFILLPDELPRRSGSSGQGTTVRREKARPGDGAPLPERNAGRPVHPVEVNTADSAALVALPGIGPSFAKGILRYREMLGGFHHLDQLAEVYVLKDKPDARERIRPLLVVDTLAIRRIDINACTVEELAAHPYIDWTPARALVNYRTHHGPFHKVADIRGCALIDESLFRKLAPYLSVE